MTKKHIIERPTKLKMLCLGLCASCRQPIPKGEVVWSYRTSGRKIHQGCYAYQIRREREWKASLLQASRAGF